jgi:hypothetical protein
MVIGWGMVLAFLETRKNQRAICWIFFVHLSRSESYTFDFDRRWHLAYIDSIEPAKSTGLPPIQDMLGRSMSDIIGSVDLAQVLVRTFRAAMARLVYNHERTTDDVREQIHFLLRTLQRDKAFVEDVMREIRALVHHAAVTLMLEAAQQEEQLVLGGTFQSALHRQILHIVSASFVLGDQDPEVRAIWLYLFRRSVDDLSSDGTGGHAFRSAFPFSFFVCGVLEALKPSVEGMGLQIEAGLQELFKLLKLEQGLSDSLSAALMQRYVADFCHMQALHAHSLSACVIVAPALSLLARAAPAFAALAGARPILAERDAHPLVLQAALCGAAPRAGSVSRAPAVGRRTHHRVGARARF